MARVRTMSSMSVAVDVDQCERTGVAVSEGLLAEGEVALVPEDGVGAVEVAEDEVEIAIAVQIAGGDAGAVGLEHADDAVGGIGEVGEVMRDEGVRAASARRE